MLFPLSWQAVATPPNYTTFKREQRPDYSPQPSEVLRIWMVYVAQGDGMLIQLPSKYDYDSDPTDADNEKHERIDIVIDGGANPTSEAGRMTDFILNLYGGTAPTIEYVVISHHDQDHVAGITRLLRENGIVFGAVYHNGLASYRRGIRGIPATGTAANAVVAPNRTLGRVNSAGQFEPGFLIRNIAALSAAQGSNEFQGVYEDLAQSVLRKFQRQELDSFERAFVGAPFINERQTALGSPLTDVGFKVVWPLATLQSYGGNNWGETINGNSVTFRMDYEEFSMVFTGDQNEKSEPELLQLLRASNQINQLDCDVLKVPHHGSSHGVREFFQREGFEPVLAVASMGDTGFRSKQMDSRAWQHPSTDVIEWLGGPHRVYHTHVHEKPFKWEDVTTEAKRRSLIEKAHILIETDGRWFRLVEIPVDSGSPLQPPTVTKTRRGDGTLWIKASTP